MALFTETAGTLSNGHHEGVANPGRRGLLVANNSDTVMTLRLGGAIADATHGIAIPANTTFSPLVGRDTPSAAWSLFCAGTSKAFCVYEW